MNSSLLFSGAAEVEAERLDRGAEKEKKTRQLQDQQQKLQNLALFLLAHETRDTVDGNSRIGQQTNPIRCYWISNSQLSVAQACSFKAFPTFPNRSFDLR